MHHQELIRIAKQIATPGKGILAADESQKTIEKRFADIKTECTEDKRREYREMLFTTPELEKYISGVILFEETLFQKASSGNTLGQVLADRGILPGIKVDKGLVDLAGSHGQKVTQGLDGLADRLGPYKEAGARFAKWRAVYNIGQNKPNYAAITANAHALARYAAICQEQGIVPIVEPEVLMDGDHSLERCGGITEHILHMVFHELHIQGVLLEGMILKPSMVISGSEAAKDAPEAVAKATLDVLLRTVPAAVPTINFLSGGQSPEEATLHLDLMNKMQQPLPWHLSFSYGRALQQPSLHAWNGETANIDAGKQELLKRAKLNSAATFGDYSSAMEG